jgi:hypothetical protein
LSEKDASGGHTEADKAALDANETQRAIQVLLENLRCGHALIDESAPAPVDNALDLLQDHAALLRARGRLQNEDKLLDVIFQACISAMIGVLNLFLDPGLSYT